jgi:radical SAM protein with 4Fe4S-binding SPASM domain
MANGEDASMPKYLQNGLLKELNGKLEPVRVAYAMEWPHIVVDDEKFDTVTDKNDNFVRKCEHIINTITVRWNGDVVPCCFDLTSRMVMGNIMDADIRDIWNSNKYIKLEEEITTGNYNSVCAKCNVVRPNVFLTRK